MQRFFHPLLALIASASDRELAKYVEYLKVVSQIRKQDPPRTAPQADSHDDRRVEDSLKVREGRWQGN